MSTPKMLIKILCSGCGTHFEYDPSENEGKEIVACPYCGNPTPLQKSVANRTSTDNYKTSTQREELQSLRTESYYKPIRSLIDILFALSIIGSTIWFFVLVSLGLSDSNERFTAISFGYLVASILVTVLVRMLVMMLIDVADVFVTRFFEDRKHP